MIKQVSMKCHYFLTINMCFCGTLWYWIAVFAMYGLMWPRMFLMLLFIAMTMHGHIRISMALCVLEWTCMALFGHVWPFLWPFVVFYCRISSFLAVIWSCFILNFPNFCWLGKKKGKCVKRRESKHSWNPRHPAKN